MYQECTFDKTSKAVKTIKTRFIFYDFYIFLYVFCDIIAQINATRQKGRDLTQSYDKCPYTHRKIQKAS